MSRKDEPSNRKKQSRQNAMEWVANKEPSTLRTSVKEFIKIDVNATSFFMNGIKENAQIGVWQEVDIVLKNLKVKILGQLFDEVLLTTDKRYKHYKTKKDCIILTYGLLITKY